MLDDDHASRSLGIEVDEAVDGSASARMLITASMVNGHGIAHGGYVFALADTAFACACNSHGPTTVAASAEITFVAPAREGDVLHARAEERVRFGRSGIYDITVHRGPEHDSTVVAEFRGHSRSTGEGRMREGPAREGPAREGKEAGE
ncbi:hydroxyphenylacetyl-CoA thioesterase PaaI [Bounagaea algeriensis]